MSYIYRSYSNDPFSNIATEEIYCSVAAKTGRPVLYLWKNGGCVVIGRNQNPWAECDIRAMEADGVKLVRRKTGGGAVYHDLGNLNYSFCMPSDIYDEKRQYAVIVSALLSLGIKAELNGRNDITVDGRKISGSAFLHRKEASLHHGTLLVDSELSVFARYLTPSADKLAGKGVKSVSARVANLKQFCANITPDAVAEAVRAEFEKVYGRAETPPEHDEKELSALRSEYESWDFRFGRTPPFETTLDTRLPFGKLTIGLAVEKGIVCDCRVWSDMLKPDFPALLEEALKGVIFDKSALALAAKEIKIEPEARLTAEWLSGCEI